MKSRYTIATILFLLPCICFAQRKYSAPVSESSLQNRKDILMFEDFERDDWYRSLLASSTSLPSTVGVTTSHVFEGNKALRVHIPKGSHLGSDISLRLYMYMQDAFGVLEEPEEIYFRTYINFGTNYSCTGNACVGKLPGPAGTYSKAGWGGRVPDGTDGWSDRTYNEDHGSAIELGSYCYHADMTSQWGEHWGWGSDAYLTKGKWYCFETHVKMNSLAGSYGNKDGIIRGWIDGKKVFEKTDMRFRHVSELKIQDIWFNVYVGGTWTAYQDMDVYYDNIVIAKDQQIGTFNGSARAGRIIGVSAAKAPVVSVVRQFQGNRIRFFSAQEGVTRTFGIAGKSELRSPVGH